MTRIEAVRFAITELEKKRRLCSKDQVGLQPLKGMEEEHAKYCDAILSLKEVCQAMQAEGVRKSIAEWQMDVKKNGPSALEVGDLR